MQNAITWAIHSLDNTTLTNPGPATEHESIISDGGRLLTMAYTYKRTYRWPLTNANQTIIPNK